jgi:hypothetical protein
MPLDHGYGVAVGTFVSFAREDPSHFGHWYHGKLRIATSDGEYEAALDVDTPSGVGVSYRVVTELTTSDIAALSGLGDGFTPLASTPASGAFDYVRSAILRDGRIVARLRRLLASRRGAGMTATERWAPTPLDRALDLLSRFRRLTWWQRRSFPWVRSDGDNALNVLEPLARNATRLYLLGEPYSTGLGVHNVHMNQGDPPGEHQAEDGIWQDGAVIIQAAEGSITVWQVKFNTQSLHTDGQGLPV